MRLPYGDEAVVPLRKLTEYLLSESHPTGSSKAAFFRNLGFDEAGVSLFEDGLLAIARGGDVIEVVPSPHGIKYVVDGGIQTPRGTAAVVRTIWIVESDQRRPRFVTAYPK